MESLPVELVELIVDLAEFRDICALRLCSRELHAKTSQRRFRSFIHADKRLCLTIHNLRTLVAVAGSEDLGRSLERLTLVGVCHVADRKSDGEDLDPEQVKLLTTAFRKIKTNGHAKILQTLALDVVVRLGQKDFAPTDAIGYHPMMRPGRVTGRGYPENQAISPSKVWKTSSRTFEVAMEALVRSGLGSVELKIFTDPLHCSLACNEIVRPGRDNSAWPVFGQTTRLALSVSHNLRRGTRDEEEGPKTRSKSVDPDSQAAGDLNVQKIVDLLSAFPNLQAVDLQWYSLSDYHPPPGLVVEQNFLQAVNDHPSIHWPHLTNCTLKGFRTEAKPLLTFFKQHPRITHITLEGIRFPWKKWQLRPLLTFFARKSSKLVYLRLDEIWEQRQVLFRPHDFDVFEEKGFEARKLVRYKHTEGQPSSCIENIWAIADSARKWGPP